MTMEVESSVPVPPQHKEHLAAVFDFRNAAHGPRGFKCRNKRKLDDYEEQAEEEEAVAPMAEADTSAAPLPKRLKTNNVVGVGKASGRPWKAPAERAGAVKNPLLSTSWEQKMKAKAEKKLFKAAKDEAVAAHKDKMTKIRKQREDAKSRKEANRLKSNVTQTITNNATLRKMMKSKKQRKLLQKADTLKQ